MARLSLRIDLDPAGRLGPGKALLLEKVAETGSISAAGRAMNMSYRRAWLLIDSLNRCFREPLVATTTGGRSGGGAEVTPFGLEVLRRYRAMEAEARAALAGHIAWLEAAAVAERPPAVRTARRPEDGPEDDAPDT